MLRVRHFLLAQGYNPAQNVICLQDNRSAILLEQNDITSSTKRTKHINVKQYFAKSRIYAGEVIVQWYLGEKMVGDFFSKPFTGSKFLIFREKIMNCRNLDWVKNAESKSKMSNDVNKDHTKQEVAMVSVGMKNTIKFGY